MYQYPYYTIVLDMETKESKNHHMDNKMCPETKQAGQTNFITLTFRPDRILLGSIPLLASSCLKSWFSFSKTCTLACSSAISLVSSLSLEVLTPVPAGILWLHRHGTEEKKQVAMLWASISLGRVCYLLSHLLRHLHVCILTTCGLSQHQTKCWW